MSDRQDTRVVAAVGVIIEIDGVREPCMTRNISRGGLFALTKKKADAGDNVRVEIVHQGKRINARARIATITDAGWGLTFVDPSGEFDSDIEELLRVLLGTGDHGEAPEGRVETNAAWSNLPDGKRWNWWRKRRQAASLASLSLDGAAVISKKRPGVGSTILIYLDEDNVAMDEPHHCRAEVVRHTDGGFAVRFLSPSLEFRRTVSRLRRGGV